MARVVVAGDMRNRGRQRRRRRTDDLDPTTADTLPPPGGAALQRVPAKKRLPSSPTFLAAASSHLGSLGIIMTTCFMLLLCYALSISPPMAHSRLSLVPETSGASLV